MPRDDREDHPNTPMKKEVTFRAYHGKRQVFSSTGKWLHPLFELEEFMRTTSYSSRSLRVEDKIVGKAAALLLVRLGIREVRAGVLSELGREVLERFHVVFSAEQTVQRIDCQTEILLAEVEDPEQAYRIVAARAGR
jgi:hypothetical protein